jgi:hypothetical protein
MVDRTIDHVDRWEVGDEFDLLREMRLLTLRILGDTLLGVDIEEDEEVVFDAADALVERADPRRFGQFSRTGYLPPLNGVSNSGFRYWTSTSTT